jgi:pimeloyl-ACP methyl ester carboxylesterase
MNSRPRLLLLLAAGVAALWLAAGAGAARSAPKVVWSPCAGAPAPFECGQVSVPLDHDEPNGAHIAIELARLPATDPQRRIGSLFLNPGGPGNSGVDKVLFDGPYLYTDDVRARFDLVGFDPRGIARSRPLRCFGNEQQAARGFTPFQFPLTAWEEVLRAEADAVLAGACERRGAKIADHMSTANVARDLDVLRQAVGDERLTFAGVSYGSYLGLTYANLFPDRVRAVVLDGVVDPVAWSTGAGDEAARLPFSNRLLSHVGTQATLEEFFRLCDAAGPACAFAPASKQRFAALMAKYREGPRRLTLPDGTTIVTDYSNGVGYTLGVMYWSGGWRDFARVLALDEATSEPVGPGLGSPRLAASAPYAPAPRYARYRNWAEGFPGVVCSDSDNPDSYAAWSAAGAAADETGYFGRIWTWSSSFCLPWAGADEDRYTGPWDARTASPVLVIGNLFDPATPYHGAVKVAGLLPGSALLTVRAWGHVSHWLSTCAREAAGRYLVELATPAPGTVCEQDFAPFGP